jgi:hypothetical protein
MSHIEYLVFIFLCSALGFPISFFANRRYNISVKRSVFFCISFTPVLYALLLFIRANFKRIPGLLFFPLGLIAQLFGATAIALICFGWLVEAKECHYYQLLIIGIGLFEAGLSCYTQLGKEAQEESEAEKYNLL